MNCQGHFWDSELWRILFSFSFDYNLLIFKILSYGKW